MEDTKETPAITPESREDELATENTSDSESSPKSKPSEDSPAEIPPTVDPSKLVPDDDDPSPVDDAEKTPHLPLMENMNNENREKELDVQSSSSAAVDEYSEHVHYDDNGKAIYTDPATKSQYEWSQEKNEWTPLASDNKTGEATAANPYQNEHYLWDPEKTEWIPKENEFYKWCDEKKQWMPKVTDTETSIKCTYDEKDGTHVYTDKDGTVFFWDTVKNAWFPKIDDDFMAKYQMNYGFVDNTTAAVATSESKKIDGNDDEDDDDDDEVEEEDEDDNEKEVVVAQSRALKRKMPPEPPKWFEVKPEQNTKVYVSKLPFDTTEEEFTELMSKYGMIMRDLETQKMKIKLYRDEKGELKGDGLCHYIKVESVDLALNLLDGFDFRGHKLSAQRAQFTMRGEYDPTKKPKRKKKDKEKIKKMQEKLFDWRPDTMRGERAKYERVVIIKNLFTPELFDKEVQLIIDYQTDLREECSKCGKVRKVIVYDRHPEGVAQVSMGDAEEADLVVQLLNGRFFGQRKLVAETWDGKTQYKIEESETENKARRQNWDSFLETADEQNPKTESAYPVKVETKPITSEDVVAEKIEEIKEEKMADDNLSLEESQLAEAEIE